MANYRKCRFCPTVVKNTFVCYSCKEKYRIIHNSGVFADSKPKRQGHHRKMIDNVYLHELGSETQRLIDFVNQSGTIHYGRYVAQQQMK